jgi:hypothetical protein
VRQIAPITPERPKEADLINLQYPTELARNNSKQEKNDGQMAKDWQRQQHE